MRPSPGPRPLFRNPSAFSCAALSAGIAILVYAFTAQTQVGFHDSAELTLRAVQLGATHAPGAPLHTLLGHLGIALVDQPAAVTAWISVLSAALTAGVLAALLRRCDLDAPLSVGTALAFALTFNVWTNAVMTELYALSALLCSVLLLLALRWRRSARLRLPLALAVVYGLALAAHFANVVLLPAYAVLVLLALRRGTPVPLLLMHAGLLALAVLLIAATNVLLAARVPPFGPYVPDSVSGLLLYMSGAEHQPVRVAELAVAVIRGIARSVEHLLILIRNFGFIGLPFALLGLWRSVRDDRPFGVFLLVFFGGYMGYFTVFGPGDYFVMVVPAYAVLALWFALGADEARRRWLPSRPALLAAVPAAALCVLNLTTQLQPRLAGARVTTAADYAARAFATLPRDSLVVARWNEFTALRYRQVLAAERGDLDLVVPARSVRHYAHGTVPDYLQAVAAAICVRPVVTNRVTPELEVLHRLAPLEGNADWLRVYPVGSEICGQESRP